MADRVTVIGWDGSPLEPAARSALRAATLVAAAPRHLGQPEVPAGAERVQLGSVPVAAGRIAGHRGSAVVIADGDPGFFGLVRALRDPAHGLEVEVIPAVSSVAAAFARAGMPWDDARVVVAGHGTLRRAVNVCRAHPKVAVLTAPGAGPAEIALMLRGVHRTFVVCEALGTDRERVSMVTPATAVEHRWQDPNVVIVLGAAQSGAGDGWLAGGTPAGPRGWGLEAADYGLPGGAGGEGSAPGMRAAQLAALGPRPGDLVWDVGSGGGLTAVEAARFGAAVIAVDRDAEACARVSAAARAAGVQLQVVHGGAPQVLGDLPEPDVIRVGGGGPRTLRACADRRARHIVTHALTRDEAEASGGELAAAGYRVRCTLLQSMELDTGTWSERGRNVAFLLSGSRT
ncbi:MULTISPECIES: precorrin-6y C5,15-methyltransferase (decarboxylating) subunit CbiE [Streptomyces]|uniref:precorrin-6y C5,15-methyltransferase (decarboxylating) subunit CbiE n=2 Tax=Streptomyces TaxID=1883 RepID=UPI000CD5A280|nr:MULTISPECIES: precorrin-6y C5,15-methyltransferase (decarboxylating) subunit CbiE [Streptomyces]